MDGSSSRGPWTGAVLALIADRPAVVSTVLAEAIGWERQDFKLHVRRRKALGLTFSLDVGYRCCLTAVLPWTHDRMGQAAARAAATRHRAGLGARLPVR